MNDLNPHPLVSELFHSLQGEGPRVGEPSVFIRFAGCNLRCRWCDTPQSSWNPQGQPMSVPEILQALEKWPRHSVVITGGEPFLVDSLPELCAQLRAQGRFVSIETAGTLYRSVSVDLFCISPKLSNSDPEGTWRLPHQQLRRETSALCNFLASGIPCIFKFVVQDAQDIAEIEALLAELREFPSSGPFPPVYLMPQARNAEDLLERSRWLSTLCMQKGWRLGDRLHIRLWGNTPGT